MLTLKEIDETKTKTNFYCVECKSNINFVESFAQVAERKLEYLTKLTNDQTIKCTQEKAIGNKYFDTVRRGQWDYIKILEDYLSKKELTILLAIL